MKRKLNKKGFAMVETLITAVSVIAILSVLYNLVLPLIGNYKANEKYEDLDTKYVAFYIKEMIETDTSNPNLANATFSKTCNYNCIPFRTSTYKCETDSNGVCITNSDGTFNYEKVENIFTTDEHYSNRNDLCNKLDSTKDTKNNQYFCNQYINGAKITNMYLIDYNTTKFKNYIKNNTSYKRSFREYVNYMPTHVNASTNKQNNYRLLIVEVEHDSYNTYGDKYYTYASIEVKYEKN